MAGVLLSSLGHRVLVTVTVTLFSRVPKDTMGWAWVR